MDLDQNADVSMRRLGVLDRGDEAQVVLERSGRRQEHEQPTVARLDRDRGCAGRHREFGGQPGAAIGQAA